MPDGRADTERGARAAATEERKRGARAAATEEPNQGARLARHLRTRAPLLAMAMGVILAVGAYRWPRGAAGPTLDAALASALEASGVALAEGSTPIWLAPPKGPLGARAVLFLGEEEGGSVDVFFAQVQHADRMVFDISRLSNLTRTGAAAEYALRRSGDHVAYLTESATGVGALTVIDLRGEPVQATARWPAFARAQNAITNFQDTGRFQGFGRVRYGLTSPARRATLTVEDGAFVVRTPEGALRVRGGRIAPLEGAERVSVAVAEKAQPGKITWVVDTVRRVSWIGPEPVAWLEHRVFGAVDLWDRLSYRFLGGDEAEEDVAEQLGIAAPTTNQVDHVRLAVDDPERGFPPPPLRPVVRDPSDGEGEWLVVRDDPFVGAFPNAPPAFAQTHLRVDPERPFARVFIVLWDPRMLQLRIMSGTREPESGTGATAPGMVDRDPEVLGRLVAGFNGGFQSMHGEFGAMSDGQVYLPPKPYAATVGIFHDGRVAVGSWLGLPEGARAFTERAAIEQIPEGMFEFRQNLTTVVEDGRVNPWRRWWWGAAPLNATEQVFVDRSGLCLTEEGFLAYFWGRSMGIDQLGNAMLAARCVRGMHLDMNVKHTAFEYYNVQRAEAPFAPLGRPLTDAEAEGPVPEAPGFVHRSRKAVSLMDPMRFPRYVGRDPRDFFYLLMRPVLPGPSIEVEGAPDAGAFDTRGLPHAGWPHAFARAHLGGEPGSRVWLVRIDGRRAEPLPVAEVRGDASSPTILAYLTGVRPGAASTGAFGLYAERSAVGFRYGVGTPPRDAVPILAAPPLTTVPRANAALGVDESGFLVYAERQPRATRSLAEAMALAGVTRAVALPDDVRLAFLADGRTVSPDEFERPIEEALALPFQASTTAYTEVLFPEVEPMPYARWGAIQDTRVRYVRPEDHVFRSSIDDPL